MAFHRSSRREHPDGGKTTPRRRRLGLVLAFCLLVPLVSIIGPSPASAAEWCSSRSSSGTCRTWCASYARTTSGSWNTYSHRTLYSNRVGHTQVVVTKEYSRKRHTRTTTTNCYRGSRVGVLPAPSVSSRSYRQTGYEYRDRTCTSTTFGSSTPNRTCKAWKYGGLIHY